MTDLSIKTVVASQLDEAWAQSKTVPAPTIAHPELTVDDAYDIQEMIIARRVSTGRSRAGWKMGLTSAGPGTTPIVGTLLDDMVTPSGSTLNLSSMIAPSVEAELVVKISETIDGPVDADTLKNGDHHVAAGIEVIDYRTTDSSGVVDWIADNSTIGHGVVGEMAPIAEVDLVAAEACLYADDRLLAKGNGSMVMGNPLEAVVWLSNHLTDRGLRLEAGDVILTGSLTGHHPVPIGSVSRFRADFGSLGVAEVSFIPQ